MLAVAALVEGARMTVAVQTDLTAAEVREPARAAAPPDQARRLLAGALVLEGASREDAARSTGMDRQTLRAWVHRCNLAGADGLVDRKAPGRQRRLSQDQLDELALCLERGPAIARDGLAALLTSLRGLGLRGIGLRGIGPSPMVRWRPVDLGALSALLTSRRGIGRRPMVEGRFGVSYQERGMGRLVRALGCSRISARPRHPRSDPQAQAELKKNCPS